VGLFYSDEWDLITKVIHNGVLKSVCINVYDNENEMRMEEKKGCVCVCDEREKLKNTHVIWTDPSASGLNGGRFGNKCSYQQLAAPINSLLPYNGWNLLLLP